MNATDFYVKNNEHAEMDRQIQDYLKRGGKIETVPRGQSGIPDGLYGTLGKNIRNRTKKKMYDDVPAEDDDQE